MSVTTTGTILNPALSPAISSVEELWLGAPVKAFDGTFAAVRAHVPTFARVPFSVESPTEGKREANPSYDAIVRLPMTQAEAAVPIGIVSKSYNLVQHHDVLRLVEDAVREADIDPTALAIRLRITERGERMMLQVLMPDEPRFRFQVAPNDSMGLQLCCLNSVEGSTRFVAVLGWLRFVCSNGMVSGASVSQLRRIHTPELDIEGVDALLRRMVRLATQQRAAFEKWIRTTPSESALEAWVDGTVKRALGVKAAVRTLHITRSGHDVSLADPFEKAVPSRRQVVAGGLVPGAASGGLTAFRAAQALSWLAGQRREVPNQIAWLAELPRLVDKLISMN